MDYQSIGNGPGDTYGYKLMQEVSSPPKVSVANISLLVLHAAALQTTSGSSWWNHKSSSNCKTDYPDIDHSCIHATIIITGISRSISQIHADRCLQL